MLLLGLDIGTSSIKVAIVDAQTQQTIATAQYPDSETPIKSLQKGWAEQSPKDWWEHAKLDIKKAHATPIVTTIRDWSYWHCLSNAWSGLCR